MKLNEALKLFTIFTLTVMAASSPLILNPDKFEELQNPTNTYKLWLNNCTKNEEMPYLNKTLVCLRPRSTESGKVCTCENSKDFNCQARLYNNHNNIIYNKVQFKGSCKRIREDRDCPPFQESLPNAFGIERLKFLSLLDFFSLIAVEGLCSLCARYETHYMDMCFQVPTCESNEFVRFHWNTEKTECDTFISLFFVEKSSLIGGPTFCPEGYSKDAIGNCKKNLKKSSRNVKKKALISYGAHRNIRNICCPEFDG